MTAMAVDLGLKCWVIVEESDWRGCAGLIQLGCDPIDVFRSRLIWVEITEQWVVNGAGQS